ncbi:hypothetical protein Slin_6160 [Spirosoma linguale DSM 74]|uniref:Uncharacterized protein n=1 Tax=Spirosoma linguale (strain ATCC 33905 / DSM 74 / LMG 10896 / Claus 1) TaxID=504472 RepID=D2QTI8_SPILD|nr:hypothetical protein Slin_6160 [Spirosoma linguale DSM 74]
MGKLLWNEHFFVTLYCRSVKDFSPSSVFTDLPHSIKQYPLLVSIGASTKTNNGPNGGFV